MEKVRSLHVTALVLTIIGAINWGLMGLFNFDLVAAIFGGQNAALSRIIYTLVGISGIILAFTAPTRTVRRDAVTPFRRAA